MRRHAATALAVCHGWLTYAAGVHVLPQNKKPYYGETTDWAVVQPLGYQSVLTLLTRPQLFNCSGQKRDYPLDLILYYFGNRRDKTPHSDVPVEETLGAVVSRYHAGGCFQNITVEYANARQKNWNSVGVCENFLGIFKPSPPAWGYKAFYWMELDVRIVNANWYDRLQMVFEQAAGGDAWAVGGIHQNGCLENTSRSEFFAPTPDNNWINRNAVYSTAPEFVEWLKTVEKYVCPEFDHVMTNLSRTQSFTADKFVDDMRFMDCQPTHDHPMNHTVSSDDIVLRYPQAVFIHSTDVWPVNAVV